MIIINSLIFCLKKYEADLIAYALMPNHIHLILFYNGKADVSGFMRDLKKYTSVKIRQLLEKDGRNETIEKLKYEKDGQKFKIWKERFDAVIIRHKNVLLTKVKYIHNNPVRYG
jgi:putative transposase